MIVSPDHYLIDENGLYAWSKERAIEAWRLASAHLDELIASGQYRKLVLLVGIPGSGKSTWLKTHKESKAIYFDATFTQARFRAPVIETGLKAGLIVEAVVMDTPLVVCKERNAERTPDRRIPEERLEQMLIQLKTSIPRRSEGFDKITYVYPKPSPARVAKMFLKRKLAFLAA